MQNDADDLSSPLPQPAPPLAVQVKSPVNRRSEPDDAITSSTVERLRSIMPAREKAVDALKTLFWVIPLTLIIWIYAEQEQVLQTPATVGSVPVQVRISANRYAAVAGNSEPTVTLKLTGPQEAVRRATEGLTKNIPRGVTIDIDPSRPDGPNQPINVVDAIQDNKIFRDNGVTVKEAIPAELILNIDKMAHLTLPVQIPPGVINISPASKFEKVDVSGPAKLLNRRPNEEPYKVYANFDGFDELKHPGEHPNLMVPVVLYPLQPEIRIDPPLVKATIIVMQSDKQEVIGPIPIEVLLPPGMMGQYTLDLTAGASVSQIHVSGPQQDIDALKNFTPKAILELLPADAARLEKSSKPLRFELPPNVKVREDDAAITAEFTLTKRTQSE